MALRHYRGGDTSARAAEWTCPSCGEKQLGKLEQGCQRCGAGKDGQKAGGLSQETQRLIEDERQAEAQQVRKYTTETLARAACTAWMDAQPIGYAGEQRSIAEEAFMAGVAWWQRQVAQATPSVGSMARFDAALDVALKETRVQEYLYLTEGQELGDTSISQPLLLTLLAALAFYRDNALSYGPVPGQLSAKDVTELIARLQPEEPEL